ncbi:MAG: HAD-IA family hydrolase [Proteobacteria bacterium]|nr:HAD-IA family hydrolase [Pseudomonadota bacterium]
MKALLWDVDGTLAETERDGHRVAFNEAFEALGLPWRWDEAHYGRLLTVSGGRERLLHDMAARTDAPPLAQQREALAAELHALKNRRYADRVAAGAVALRPAVAALIAEARRQGLRQAIATTTSRANLRALLAAAPALGGIDGFDAVVCGEDVQRKKPDPEVFQRALALLQLPSLQALAIEDSPGGAAAARAAGVPVVVTRSHYFAQATIEGAVAIGPGLDRRDGWRPALTERGGGGEGRVTLADLQHWCALGDCVSQFT